MASLVRFKPRTKPGQTSVTGASGLTIARERLRLAIGALLGRAGLPGVVRPVEIEDAVSGNRVAISVGPLFTKLSVGDRDYYFHRLNGRYDGSGSGL
jgi:hypothetical protein